MRPLKYYQFGLTKKYSLVLATATAVFAYFFLLFFQPFGVNNYRADENISLDFAITLFVFAILIFVIILGVELLLKPLFFNITSLGRYVIWILFEIAVVGSVTFLLYNYMGNFHDFNLGSYLKHIFEIGTVLIFPILATIFYFKHSGVVKDLEDVLSVSNEYLNVDEIVLLSGDYKKDKIAVQLKNIVFLESEDNYVGLNYMEGTQLKKYLIRSTLTQMEKKLSSEFIVRCNRSILINLLHFQSSKTKAKHLIITLKGTDTSFTVSKTHRTSLLQQIEQLAKMG